jgi:hypothetical protein
LTPEQSEKLSNYTHYRKNPGFPCGIFTEFKDGSDMEDLVYCLIVLGNNPHNVDFTKPFTTDYQNGHLIPKLKTKLTRLFSEGYLLYENDEYYLTDKLLKAIISKYDQIQTKTEEQNFIDLAGGVYPEITFDDLDYLAGSCGYRLKMGVFEAKTMEGPWYSAVRVFAIDTYKIIGSGDCWDDDSAFKNAIVNLLAVKNGLPNTISTHAHQNQRR